jgi:hypothetical protein
VLPAAAGAQEAAAEPACLERLKILHSESVLEEQRRVGPAAPDFQTAFAAAEIGPDHLPVQAVSSFRVGGAPILWFAPDRKAAVVDARVFGDLAAVDVPRLAKGARAVVGKIRVGRDALPGREVAKLLLFAGVVRVYWHVEADVCLADEQSEAGAYSLRISGAHTYFTNEKNTDPFDFVLSISAAGEIAVEAR